MIMKCAFNGHVSSENKTIIIKNGLNHVWLYQFNKSPPAVHNRFRASPDELTRQSRADIVVSLKFSTQLGCDHE